MSSKDSFESASVLAFEKKLVPSDGRFFGTSWDRRLLSPTPLPVQEKSVRGTISNRLKKSQRMNPAMLDAEVQKPNLQTIDSCCLSNDQDTLKIAFTLKVLSGVEKPSACNSGEFNANYRIAARAYIESEGFRELAMRYATNIANARFLWRNRVGAEKIEVVVKTSGENGHNAWTFDAKKISTRHFDNRSQSLVELAEKIADALSGKQEYALFDVCAYAQIGEAQAVYPSEELVLDKGAGKSKKSRILYQIGGIAGMHSQKIGNALRTVDTWYPDYNESQIGPIAAEPYGTVTNLGKAFRSPKDKADFYTLFDKFVRGEPLPGTDDAHYVMAVLVRGGVFGESSKE